MGFTIYSIHIKERTIVKKYIFILLYVLSEYINYDTQPFHENNNTERTNDI